ncbi:MAG: hypothetical protein WA395_09325 [Nitrososphaeraceae archaeon]
MGHSYGGMVIPGIAAKQPQRLAHLVYLDAYIPLEGKMKLHFGHQIRRKSI